MSEASDLTAVRDELLERRSELTRRLDKLAAPRDPSEGLSFGKRIGEGTTEAIGRLTDIGVGRSLEASLHRVERALAKLEEDTYGTCDVCAAPIDPERLEFLPESTLCRDCADKEPRRRG
jgi:DnaK suppressor protein